MHGKLSSGGAAQHKHNATQTAVQRVRASSVIPPLHTVYWDFRDNQPECQTCHFSPFYHVTKEKGTVFNPTGSSSDQDRICMLKKKELITTTRPHTQFTLWTLAQTYGQIHAHPALDNSYFMDLTHVAVHFIMRRLR